jgi:hypothetical protein
MLALIEFPESNATMVERLKMRGLVITMASIYDLFTFYLKAEYL